MATNTKVKLSTEDKAYLTALIATAIKHKEEPVKFLVKVPRPPSTTSDIVTSLIELVLRSVHELYPHQSKTTPPEPLLKENLACVTVDRKFHTLKVQDAELENIDYELTYGYWFQVDRETGLPWSILHNIGQKTYSFPEFFGIYDRTNLTHLQTMVSDISGHCIEQGRAGW